MRKLRILCAGDPVGSRMSEGYLQFFAGDKAQICCLPQEGGGPNLVAVQIMAEDNIDISVPLPKCFNPLLPLDVDYLISIAKDDEEVPLPKVKSRKSMHFRIPLSPRDLSQAEEAYFRQMREEVKRNILKFVGKELTEYSDPMVF